MKFSPSIAAAHLSFSFRAYLALASIELDCSGGCIDRSRFSIRSIVHGTKDDPFWQRVQASAIQAGKDMGVDFKMDLYESFDPDAMAKDIQAIATSSNPPDAVIVTIPDANVASAVKEASSSSVPFFGLNSGHEFAKEAGVLSFVAMDERLAGKIAGEGLLAIKPAPTNPVFINNEMGNGALEQRKLGYEDALGKIVTEIELNDMDLTGCPVDMLLLSSSSQFQSTMTDIKEHCTGKDIAVGVFDETPEVVASIAAGDLALAVSQQEHLQGALPVIMASVHATTRKAVAPSPDGENGIYLTGPRLTTISNLPSDTIQSCKADGFPTCPNKLGLDGNVSDCDCTERSEIKIAGVTHGHFADTWWDPIYSAFKQSARDMGISYEETRLEPQDSQEVFFAKMASLIESRCKDDIDGIFVTIPNEVIIPAVQSCQNLGVNIVAINAGKDVSKDLGLLSFVGMGEYDAGVEAANRLIEVNPGLNTIYCNNHNVVSGTLDRCAGVEVAANAAGRVYGGMIEVPIDDNTAYQTIVERTVPDEGDWSGIGFVSLNAAAQLEALLQLKESHPGFAMGTFDLSDLAFSALDDGLLQFGIDQNPYLQGYWPIPVLTLAKQTRQTLLNNVIASGPSFIISSPTEAQQTCEATFYEVCVPADDAGGDSGLSRQGSALAITFGIIGALLLC